MTDFRNNFTNLIECDPARFRSGNVGRARTWGVEAAVKDLDVRLSDTFTDTKDKDAGEELLRRVRRKAAARADYAPAEKLHRNASPLFAGVRQDVLFGPFPCSPRLRPRCRTLLCFAQSRGKSYKVTEKIRRFVQGDDLRNRHDEEIAGLGTPGLSGDLGASTEFQGDRNPMPSLVKQRPPPRDLGTGGGPS